MATIDEAIEILQMLKNRKGGDSPIYVSDESTGKALACTFSPFFRNTAEYHDAKFSEIPKYKACSAYDFATILLIRD